MSLHNSIRLNNQTCNLVVLQYVNTSTYREIYVVLNRAVRSHTDRSAQRLMKKTNRLVTFILKSSFLRAGNCRILPEKSPSRVSSHNGRSQRIRRFCV